MVDKHSEETRETEGAVPGWPLPMAPSAYASYLSTGAGVQALNLFFKKWLAFGLIKNPHWFLLLSVLPPTPTPHPHFIELLFCWPVEMRKKFLNLQTDFFLSVF